MVHGSQMEGAGTLKLRISARLEQDAVASIYIYFFLYGKINKYPVDIKLVRYNHKVNINESVHNFYVQQ